ncbi:MAG: trypsin-like peptidase domain-containing protein [Thiohalobacterales bacterium]|nr:trypsin-like peptidase domain-containing protein [Thiohalobacterales bacterium]
MATVNLNFGMVRIHTRLAGLPAGLLVLLLSLVPAASLADTGMHEDRFILGWHAYQSGEYHAAFDYWLPLARQGHANAQLNVGLMYDAGQGMPVDHDRAVHWYRKSAESGLAAAQYNLGLMYLDGQGVERDSSEASTWLERAAAQGLQAARTLLESGLPAHEVLQETDPDNFLSSLEGAATGTAWTVTGGYAVTSEHVVAGVRDVELYDVTGQRYLATVVFRDTHNDLAVMQINDSHSLPPALPLSHDRARTGSSVFTMGFPRVDVLGRTPKLSTGIISAANGYRDNPGNYQTSVQIQPGNSGGPLLNMNGEVVGVMAAMLGDASAPSSIQPGVSYAVKVEKLHAALQALPQAEQDTAQLPGTPAGLADLAERVQHALLLVVATR